MRIAVAEISQETDTFSPVLTGLEDFELNGLLYGDEILDKRQGVGKIGGGGITIFDKVFDPALKKTMKMMGVEFDIATTTDTGGNVVLKLDSQTMKVRLNIGIFKGRTKETNTAVDVVTNPAGRNNPILIWIGSYYPTNGKAITLVHVGHG